MKKEWLSPMLEVLDVSKTEKWFPPNWPPKNPDDPNDPPES